MKCPEKEDLQQKCTRACEEFETATEQLRAAGIWLDLRSKMVSWKPMPTRVDDRAVLLSALTSARQNHLNASYALSTHLSKHRC